MSGDGCFSARVSINGRPLVGSLDQGLLTLSLESEGLRLRLRDAATAAAAAAAGGGTLRAEDAGWLYLDYAELDGFGPRGYDVELGCGQQLYTLSWLGREREQFLHTLWEKYNQRVLQCLFAAGEPLSRAQGQFELHEDGRAWGGQARLLLYADALFVLPEGGQARRLPLCGMDCGGLKDWRIELSYGQNACYLWQLGWEAKNFCTALQQGLEQQARAAAQQLRQGLPQLPLSDAQALGRLLCGGRALSLEQLQGLSPEFVRLMQQRVEQTDAEAAPAAAANAADAGNAGSGGGRQQGIAELYHCLCQQLPPRNLAWGLLKCERAESRLPLWLAAWQQGRAMVEYFSDDAAASFLYAYTGSDAEFLALLNSGMEAAGFHRELISLPAAQLGQNAAARIALRRSPSLRRLRQCFRARQIHQGSSWRQKLAQHLGLSWPQA